MVFEVCSTKQIAWDAVESSKKKLVSGPLDLNVF